MSLKQRRILTLALLILITLSSVLAFSPSPDFSDSIAPTRGLNQNPIPAGSSSNTLIPYVDNHYGAADGIIDPWEYAVNYTDKSTGVTAYFEHNGTILYVGLSAQTSEGIKPEWIGFGWQNYSEDFTTAGLNNSDFIIGYAPGTPHTDYWRVIGTDIVRTHYVLRLRNGTLYQEGDFPDEGSDYELQDLPTIEKYRDAIYGMRIGEVRHFVVAPEEVPTYQQEDHELRGLDLDYTITLTNITRGIETRNTNPAMSSQIIFSDRYGIGTFKHIPDSNQSRIISANATDDGTTTQLEYAIRLNSTDLNDISFHTSTDIKYPFIFMFGASEDLDDFPEQHTHWSDPVMITIEPNLPPSLTIVGPEHDEILEWVVYLTLNATDRGLVRWAAYRIESIGSGEVVNWTDLEYNSGTKLWEKNLDISDYDNGQYSIWFNATDKSNKSSVIYVNVAIQHPFAPLHGMKMSVIRTSHIGVYHEAKITDEITIRNNGSVSIGGIDWFLPEKFESNILQFEVEDSNSKVLPTLQVGINDGLIHWKIYFFEPVDFQEEYSITVTTNLHSLHQVSEDKSNKFKITYTRHPVVPYVLASSELIITSEAGDSVFGTSPEGIENNVEPMSTDELSYVITSSKSELVGDRVTKITMDPWGWLSVEETISVENIGTATDNIIEFQVPAFSTAITIYDEVGILARSQETTEHDFNESVNLIIELSYDRYGDLGFQIGDKYTFQIDYVVQIESHQELTAEGNKLKIPIGTLGVVLVRSHIVDLILPYSINTIEVSGEYRLLYGVFDTILRYTKYNSTEINPVNIELTYQVTLWVLVRPVIFSLLAGLVALVYVGYRKVELPEEVTGPSDEEAAAEEPRQTGAPPDLLKTFANLYSRKTALNMDLEKLDAARRRGKVKKREYMIRERDLKSQIEEIDSGLPKVKDELTSYGSKYRDIIAQLELQNEKIEGAKAGLRQLLLRKKKQRISRAAFEKSKQDYLKTIQKATTATDRILLTIQEEAGEI